MELIDAHAHLTDAKYDDDLEDVLMNADAAGVSRIVSAGYDFASSKAATELANAYETIFSTAGIHPENVANFENDKLDKDFFENEKENFEIELKNIKKLAKNEKVVAIGEIGLDYHFIDFVNKKHEDDFGHTLSAEEIEEIKNLQKYAFEKQIELAESLGKSIVVHSRDAMGDTLEILKKHRLKRQSLLHCYSGSLESAKILMELGYSFSFGGVCTFKNAKNVQEVVKNLPLERILLETDCPYMSPEPYRGKRNEPKNVLYVADAIARLKGISIDEVARVTTENAKRLFGI